MQEKNRQPADELQIQVSVAELDHWDSLEGVSAIVASGEQTALTGLKMLGSRGTALEMAPSEVAAVKAAVGLAA